MFNEAVLYRQEESFGNLTFFYIAGARGGWTLPVFTDSVLWPDHVRERNYFMPHSESVSKVVSCPRPSERQIQPSSPLLEPCCFPAGFIVIIIVIIFNTG